MIVEGSLSSSSSVTSTMAPPPPDGMTQRLLVSSSPSPLRENSSVSSSTSPFLRLDELTLPSSSRRGRLRERRSVSFSVSCAAPGFTPAALNGSAAPRDFSFAPHVKGDTGSSSSSIRVPSSSDGVKKVGASAENNSDGDGSGILSSSPPCCTSPSTEGGDGGLLSSSPTLRARALRQLSRADTPRPRVLIAMTPAGPLFRGGGGGGVGENGNGEKGGVGGRSKTEAFMSRSVPACASSSASSSLGDGSIFSSSEEALMGDRTSGLAVGDHFDRVLEPLPLTSTGRQRAPTPRRRRETGHHRARSTVSPLPGERQFQLDDRLFASTLAPAEESDEGGQSLAGQRIIGFPLSEKAASGGETGGRGEMDSCEDLGRKMSAQENVEEAGRAAGKEREELQAENLQHATSFTHARLPKFDEPNNRRCARCKKRILIFKTRCTVCRKLYCRSCLEAAMPEGKKCHECIGEVVKEHRTKPKRKGYLTAFMSMKHSGSSEEPCALDNNGKCESSIDVMRPPDSSGSATSHSQAEGHCVEKKVLASIGEGGDMVHDDCVLKLDHVQIGAESMVASLGDSTNGNATHVEQWRLQNSGSTFFEGAHLRTIVEPVNGDLNQEEDVRVNGTSAVRAAKKQTGVFVNGKELSQKEFDWLQRNGGRSSEFNLKQGYYWYDRLSGLWGKESHRWNTILPSGLSIGGSEMAVWCSSGRTGAFVNGREVDDTELVMLRRMGIGRFDRGEKVWLASDGSFGKEGKPAIGNIWRKMQATSMGASVMVALVAGQLSTTPAKEPTAKERLISKFYAEDDDDHPADVLRIRHVLETQGLMINNVSRDDMKAAMAKALVRARRDDEEDKQREEEEEQLQKFLLARRAHRFNLKGEEGPTSTRGGHHARSRSWSFMGLLGNSSGKLAVGANHVNNFESMRNPFRDPPGGDTQNSAEALRGAVNKSLGDADGKCGDIECMADGDAAADATSATMVESRVGLRPMKQERGMVTTDMTVAKERDMGVVDRGLFRYSEPENDKRWETEWSS